MMVSSKFARSNHAFRVPDVCKKKLPPGGEEGGIPYPPPFVNYYYDVDVSWIIWRYTFSGNRTLEREETMFGNSWRWLDDPVPPADGQRAYFQHNPGNGQWVAQLLHYEGGFLRLSGNNTGFVEGEPSDLATGPFLIDFGVIWQGTRDGIITPAGSA